MNVDTLKIVTTLLMTQIVPQGIGILIHSKRLRHAEQMQKPANLLTAVLSLILFALVITLQYRT